MNISRFGFVYVAFVSALFGGAQQAASASFAKAILPAETLAFPTNLKGIVTLDVKRLAASPLFRQGDGSSKIRIALLEAGRPYGLDIERDVDRVYLALGLPGGIAPVVLEGNFDRRRLERALKTAQRETKRINVAGLDMITFNRLDRQARSGSATLALCVVSPKALVIGAPPTVEEMLMARVAGRRPLLANMILAPLISEAPPESGLWLVADATWLNQASSDANASRSRPIFTFPGPVFPKLRSVLATGVFADTLEVTLVGEATDAEAARNTAEMMRSLLALAVVSAKHLDLQELAAATSLSSEGDRVHVRCRPSYALVERLVMSVLPKPAVAPAP